MSKFRKKPVVIEARQFDGSWGCANDLLEWINLSDACWSPLPTEGGFMVIPTLEGPHLAMAGDWIIQGVKGELYPVKDEIFRLTYEAVADGSSPAAVVNASMRNLTPQPTMSPEGRATDAVLSRAEFYAMCGVPDPAYEGRKGWVERGQERRVKPFQPWQRFVMALSNGLPTFRDSMQDRNRRRYRVLSQADYEAQFKKEGE